MNDDEILQSSKKDYIISILDEMDEDELIRFEEKFKLIDMREILSHIIRTMDEDNEVSEEKLADIYGYVRDAYWSGE